ncbi:MAG: DNA repair protein RadA [Elusimicrobiota bacterium]
MIKKFDRQKTVFVCQNCGYGSAKWMGKCQDCGQWNTFVEEKPVAAASARRMTEFSSGAVELGSISAINVNRIKTGIEEFDRILGGGVMPASLVLIGGPPGIGKSTLMLQVVSSLADRRKVLYISGEESLEQIKNRADRLSIKNNLYLMAETNLENMIAGVGKVSPDIIVVDSIQTVYRSDLSSAPGSVGQVRECAAEFLHLAKGRNITVFVLGHVTKEGDIAGPRILEHIVDTVLYFESERHHTYRILRSYKNRFGPTSEIGVFEMRSDGLAGIENPSALFLSERSKDTPGCVVASAVEGTRPLLLEVQALVTKTDYGFPRRMSTGIDYNRVVLLISILENRIGSHLSSQDVYVNLAGGIKVKEPAVDLSVCCAIYSAFSNLMISQDSIFIGEVGLAGEVRGVSFINERLRESEKMGFRKAYLPSSNKKDIINSGMELFFAEKLSSVIESIRK